MPLPSGVRRLRRAPCAALATRRVRREARASARAAEACCAGCKIWSSRRRCASPTHDVRASPQATAAFTCHGITAAGSRRSDVQMSRRVDAARPDDPIAPVALRGAAGGERAHPRRGARRRGDAAPSVGARSDDPVGARSRRSRGASSRSRSRRRSSRAGPSAGRSRRSASSSAARRACSRRSASDRRRRVLRLASARRAARRGARASRRSSLGRDAAAPGRIVDALLAEGRAACAATDREGRRRTRVPFVSATWLCAPERGAPRLVGRAPIGGVVFTASDARVSDDLRRIDLDDARLALPASREGERRHVPRARRHADAPRPRAVGAGVVAAAGASRGGRDGVGARRACAAAAPRAPAAARPRIGRRRGGRDRRAGPARGARRPCVRSSCGCPTKVPSGRGSSPSFSCRWRRSAAAAISRPRRALAGGRRRAGTK